MRLTGLAKPELESATLAWFIFTRAIGSFILESIHYDLQPTQTLL
ncbi:MAG: hypothetical protein Kow0088_21280 [Anaerolineales bacterium]